MKTIEVRFFGFIESSGKRVSRSMRAKARSNQAALDQAREHFKALHQRCIYPTYLLGAEKSKRSMSRAGRFAITNAEE